MFTRQEGITAQIEYVKGDSRTPLLLEIKSEAATLRDELLSARKGETLASAMTLFCVGISRTFFTALQIIMPI